mmetsp:Transcript_14562/g.31660  ORF Transcript_14562/g.31660 Transcript_14562/m.31660 type:complete len:413 (+) Transcript_14562:174-1412(+)
MCSQPQPCDSYHVLLFDAIRKTLHHNHKFATGDLSQVCDGRNWELVRHADEANSKSRTTSEGEISDDVDKIKSGVIASYMPACGSSCSTGSGSSGDSSPHRQPFTSPVSPTQDNKPPLEDVDVEKEAVSPTKVPAKPKNQDNSLQSLSTDSTRRPSRRHRRRHSNEDKVCDSDQLPSEEKPSRRLSVDSSSISFRGKGSKCTTESSSKSDSRVSRVQQRLSSSFTSSRQRGPVEDKVRRRSLSTRRRHSCEDKPSNSDHLALKGKPQRKLSVDSNTTSSSRMSGPRCVRKLSEPRHRCSTTNQKVSGIMRPARYSSNNLAGMVSSPSPPPVITKKSSNVRRNASCIDLSSMNKETFDELGSAPPVRTISVENFHRFKTNNGINPEPQDMSHAHWIASGVNFSKNMEVYLFKT